MEEYPETLFRQTHTHTHTHTHIHIPFWRIWANHTKIKLSRVFQARHYSYKRVKIRKEWSQKEKKHGKPIFLKRCHSAHLAQRWQIHRARQQIGVPQACRHVLKKTCIYINTHTFTRAAKIIKKAEPWWRVWMRKLSGKEMDHKNMNTVTQANTCTHTCTHTHANTRTNARLKSTTCDDVCFREHLLRYPCPA